MAEKELSLTAASSIFGRNVSGEDKLRGLFRVLYGREIPAATSVDAKRVFSSFLESQLTPSTPFSTFSYFSSLFLLRKSLPAAAPDVPAYLAKLGQIPVQNPAFIETIRTYVPMMFPRGWDRGYRKCCETISVSKASCFELGRGAGGARKAAQETLDYDSFLELCLTGTPIAPERKVSVIHRDGKQRIVTVATLFQGTLLPLHLMIYDRLSKFKWLLRGDAKMSVLKEFVTEKAEVFVSGDYESATDSFNSLHSKELLRNVLFHAQSVPEGIRSAAIDSLTGLLVHDGSVYSQSTGQLMGNFLSFPLLCLTNFLTVVHSLGWQRANTIPLKINGDDIVFRCSREEADRWASCVRDSGLVLSTGKTLLHWRFFSINSAFFCATRGKPRIVPVIRTSTLTKDCKSPDSLAARAKCFSWGWQGKAKRLMQAFALDWHHGVAIKGSVSWTRGWGLSVGLWELEKTNLLERELSLLERPHFLDRPRSNHQQQKLPARFVKVRERWSCRDCREIGSHSLSVHTARETWCEKESANLPAALEIRVVRRRISLKRWLGCSWRRFKFFFQRNRRGMAILWSRDWPAKQRERRESYIDRDSCCDRCWWACEEERSKVERSHLFCS